MTKKPRSLKERVEAGEFETFVERKGPAPASVTFLKRRPKGESPKAEEKKTS